MSFINMWFKSNRTKGHEFEPSFPHVVLTIYKHKISVKYGIENWRTNIKYKQLYKIKSWNKKQWIIITHIVNIPKTNGHLKKNVIQKARKISPPLKLEVSTLNYWIYLHAILMNPNSFQIMRPGSKHHRISTFASD